LVRAAIAQPPHCYMTYARPPGLPAGSRKRFAPVVCLVASALNRGRCDRTPSVIWAPSMRPAPGSVLARSSIGAVSHLLAEEGKVLGPVLKAVYARGSATGDPSTAIGERTQMIKAAIVGLGWWGGIIHRELASSEVIRPVLGVEPVDAARQVAEAAGLETTARFEDALERPDIRAVILSTPHKHHAAQIVAAAKAGKHVFCEKPLCTTAREMDAVVEAVTAAGVQLGIGHERRFEPGIIDLRARLAAGELGTALAMEGNFSQDKFLTLSPGNWRLSSVGPLSATGIHLVDLSIALLGKPKEVWARLAARGSPFANGDTLGVMIAFESGASALLTAILATSFMGRIAVYGSQGWIEIRDRTHPEHPTGWDVTVAARGKPPATHSLPPHPAVRDNLEAFGRAAAAAAPYPVSIAEIDTNVRTFEAITRSALSGKLERI
jgi:predicted dehydrogenase